MSRPAIVSIPLLLFTLLLMFCWHIAVGAKLVPLQDVFNALVAYDESNFNHVVINELRLPRALYAVLVGASLAVAGALMQGVTRNPLAEPGILGLLIGASFAVVVLVGYFNVSSPTTIPLFAAVGAAATAALVWAVAAVAPSGATPLALVLAGAAISGFLGALISLIHLIDQDNFEQMRVWLSGTLAAGSSHMLFNLLPWFFGGLALALLLARQVTVLAMGEEAAVGLGVNVVRVRALCMCAVIVLTAASVAVAGPIAFVGLVIPHATRLLVGADYRHIVPFSAIIGAIYLLAVDTAARLVLAPVEISTGIATAVLGAPLFIWLISARL